ncbi:NADH:flavorubredoxin oxidoreductase [Aliivibrio fischeri]|uniref:NADH:flavorubredoxin reductase NorW n=1 Tax=Aliivibrio fischeri TaxID=668 RepID=UPI00080D9C66|nr:NADH:flavorubredoxin reductase NorW [Aliivibrio fischeri]OCH06784.1 NADH:flavorubredoxin oxidoreductase [Aliivibrio fischeri]OCH59337.1 NADH:flavorubredoxin oxidoreductase [Aliivibrio fischeri]
MSLPIVIIGSGFASYQLIKTIRRTNSYCPIHVFTNDSGDDYNKPDLSHVFSKQQSPEEVVTLSGGDFAEQYNVILHRHTLVESINPEQQSITANGEQYTYDKLVLATGSHTFVPPFHGDGCEDILTLNSLKEFSAIQQKILDAKNILVIGGGLIGTELAMDLATAGKMVTLVEPNTHLLANMVPDFISLPLEKACKEKGVTVNLSDCVQAVNKQEQGYRVTTSNGHSYCVDCVISAAGLKPNTQLAIEANLTVNRGIVVDSNLQTSVNNIYALGDCAEIEGKVMAYLQPILLSANALAKTLLGTDTALALPNMMVKVKTPNYPIQLAGNTSTDIERWSVDIDTQGLCAKAYDVNNLLTGFVVTNERVKNAFPLFRELNTTN